MISAVLIMLGLGIGVVLFQLHASATYRKRPAEKREEEWEIILRDLPTKENDQC